MNKTTVFSLALLSSSFFSTLHANEGNPLEDKKLNKYHSVLLNRPESSSLFEKFYSTWLANYDEQSLETFLEKKSTTGSSADKQIFAYFLMQKGREKDALNVLNLALESDTKNAQIYLDRAKSHSRMLDFEKAVNDIEKALSLKADDDLFILKASKLKGRYLTRQGQADAAVAHWSKLAEENPDDQELIEDVIDILTGDGLYAPALIHAKKLQNSTRDSYKKALRSLRVADILQKKGDRDEALKVYQSNLAIAGANSWLEREVIAQIENLFRKEDNIQGLKVNFEVSKKKYPQRVLLAQKLADVYSELNEHKKAHELYLDIIKRSPDDQELKNGLLQALEKADDHKASKALLESMIELLPKDPELSIKLAEIFHKLKDKKNTLASLGEYRKKSDDNVANAMRHANMLRGFSYPEETNKIFSEALKKFPTSDELKFSAADYFIFAEQTEKADQIWETLAESQSIETITRLLETLLTQNKKEQALKVINKNKESLKTNRAFITLAIRVSEANQDTKSAIGFAKIALQISKTPTEIDSAIQKLTNIIIKGKGSEDALAALKLKKTPSTKELFLKASLLDAQGEQGKANEVVEELSKSEDIASLLIAVRIHERRYDLNEAAAVMERVLTLPGGLKGTYLKQLCAVYERSGDLEKAQIIASRWKKLTPNDKAAWLMEVSLFESSGEHQKALENLRRGVEKFEGEVDILGKLANLYTLNSNYTQAYHLYWRLYDEAKDLNERIQWTAELAKIAELQGTSNELIDTLTERRRTSPQAVAPVMALAEVYRSLNRTNERRQLLLEATRLKPNDSSILIEIANSDLRQGQRKLALAILKKAQIVDKTDTSTRRVAKLYFEENDYEKGMLELEKLGTGKLDARKLEALVFDLIKQEAFEEAKNYLDLHITNFPNDGRLLLLSSLVEYEVGFIKESYAAAIKLLERDFSFDKVTKGWSINDSSNRYSNSPFGKASQSAIIKSVKAASNASSILNLISNIGSNNRYSYSYGNSNQAANVNSILPADEASLKLMTRMHACRILGDLGKEQQEEWGKQLADAGETNIELWTIFALPQQNQGDKLESLVLANLENPVYLEIAASRKLDRMELKLPKELLEKLRANPNILSQLYQDILSYCVADDAEEKEHERLILEKIGESEKLEPLPILALLSLQKNTYEPNSKLSISDEVLKAYKKYVDQNPTEVPITNFYNRSSQTQPNLKQIAYFWAKSMIDRSTLHGDDYKKIAELFNKSNEKNQQFVGWRSGGIPTLENSLTVLSNLSFFQLSHFHQGYSYNGANKIDFKKLNSEIDLIKNPILRYLIANKANPDKKNTEHLIAAKANETYKADALILEASAAHKDSKSSLVIAKFLEEARNASLDKGQRQSIDQLLIQAAQLPSDTSKFKSWDESLKSSVKAAARRLMLGRKITESSQIQSLITALEMENEQHRFLTKKKTSIRTAKKTAGFVIGAAPRQSSHSSSSSNPRDKVKKLLESGKKDTALIVLTNELRKGLKSNTSSYEFNRLVKVAKDENIEAEVLEKLSPGNSVSPRKWLAYYQTAEAFKNKEESQKALKFLKNLSITPQSLRLPLGIALMTEQPDKAIKLLKGHPNQDEVLSGLARYFRESVQTHSNLGRNTEKGDEAVFTFLDSHFADIKFILKLTESYSNAEFTSLNNFSYLYSIYSNSTGNINRMISSSKSKRKESYLKKYSNISANFDKKALANIAVAEPAFAKLYKEHQKGKTLKELGKTLLSSLEKLEPLSSKSYQHGSSFYGGRQDQQQLSRSTFIGRMIIAQKNPKLISTELLKKLEQVDLKFATQLKFFKSNALLSDNEIGTRITEAAKDSKLSELVQWDQMLTIRPNEKNNDILVTLVMNHILDEKPLSSDPNQLGKLEITELLPRLANIISVKKRVKLEKLLTTVSNRLNKETDPEKRLLKWTELFMQTNNGANRNNEYVVFLALLEQVIQNPKATAMAVNFINSINYPYFLTGQFNLNSYSSNSNQTSYDADGWLDIFKDASFLAQPSEIKVKSLDLISPNLIEKLKAKYPNSSYYFNDNRLEDTATTDWALMIRQLKSTRYSFSSGEENKTVDEVIEKLKKINDDRKLSAQVSLLLLDRISISQFCKDNKQLIINSPTSFKQVLVDTLSLNQNNEALAAFRLEGLDKNLPLNQEQLKQNESNEFDNFLALKAPVQNTSTYSLGRTVSKLIKSRIQSNPENCYKIIDHYIDLIKNTPEFERQYTPETYHVTVLQDALIDRVIEPLRNERVYPKDLLKLVYHLQKREDYLELNIISAIPHTMPVNWSFDKSIAKDQKTAVPKIIKEYAKEYAKIEDPEYAEFFKSAWFVYFNSQGYHKKLHFYPNATEKVISSLMGSDAKENEFYDWLKNCSRFDFYLARYSSKVNKYFEYPETNIFNNRANIRPKVEKLIEDAKGFKLKNRILMASALYMNPEALTVLHHEISPKSIEFAADTFIEAVNTDVKHHTSSDTRLILQLRMGSHVLSPDKKEALAHAAGKGFYTAMEFIAKGGNMHRNHVENLAIGASSSAKGAKLISDAVIKYPRQVKGLASIAQILLKHGHFDAILKVMPQGSALSVTRSHPRVFHSAEAEENLPKLLERYKNLEEKAMVAYLLHTPDGSLLKSVSKTTASERYGQILDLAQKADPNFPLNTNILLLPMEKWNILEPSDFTKLQPYFEKNKSTSSLEHFVKLITSEKVEYKDRQRMRVCLSNAVYTNNQPYLREFIDQANKFATQEKVSYIQEIYFVEDVIETTLGAVHTLYGKGTDDPLVIELLPIYRETIAACLNLFPALRYKGNKQLMAFNSEEFCKYIHYDLGKESDLKNFTAKMSKKKKVPLNHGKKTLPLTFATDVHHYGSSGFKNSLRDTSPLVLRLLNTAQFQRDVVTLQSLGGALDTMIDHGLYTSQQALDLLNSGEIQIKVPSFKAVLLSDRAHIAALTGDYDSMIKNYQLMNAVFEESPTPKPSFMIRMNLRAMKYLTVANRKDLASTIFPAKLVNKMNKTQKKTYKTLKKELK